MEDKKKGFRPKYKRSTVFNNKNGIPSRIASDRVNTGSIVDKAKKQGVYLSIKYYIRDIKRADPNATFDDVVDKLCERYPLVFGEKGNIRNTRGVIESDNSWSCAYQDFDGNLVKRIEDAMEDIANKPTDTDVQKMEKFDLIKKYEILKYKAISERIKVQAEMLEAENECKRLDKLLDKAADEAVDAGNTYIDTIIINDGDDSIET